MRGGGGGERVALFKIFPGWRALIQEWHSFHEKMSKVYRLHREIGLSK